MPDAGLARHRRSRHERGGPRRPPWRSTPRSGRPRSRRSRSGSRSSATSCPRCCGPSSTACKARLGSLTPLATGRSLDGAMTVRVEYDATGSGRERAAVVPRSDAFEPSALRGDLPARRHRVRRLPRRGGRRAPRSLRPARRDGPGQLRQRAGPVVGRGPGQRPVPGRLAAEPAGRQAAHGVLRSGTRRSAASPRAWRRAPQASAEPCRSPTCAGPSIDSFLAQLLSECEEEMLTAQPRGRPGSPRSWPRRRCATSALVERGVKMRTLYQHSARRSSVTHKYVAAVTARGRRGAHAGRVLQPDDRRGPPGRRDSAPGPGRCRRRGARAGRRRLSRRRLRALVGASPPVHQPGHLADEGHRRPSSAR